MNDSGPVSESRRVRVLDAIRVLGYTPNESARKLRNKSSATVGLIVPDLGNQFFARVAEGVGSAAAEQGALMVVCIPEATNQPTQNYVQLLRSQRLDGIVYLPGGEGMSLSLALELSDTGPVVMIDERIRGFDVPAVIADSRGGAREIAEYVLSMGHRKLAFVNGPESLWTSEQRAAGYREALARYDIDPRDATEILGDHREESGAQAAAQLLSASPDRRPTAILCANDLMALGVYRYCRAAGLRIPEDVSVTGFDGIVAGELVTPGLTTVLQPAHEMGRQAVLRLFSLINGDLSKEDQHLALPTTLIVRDSVAPPRRH